MRKLKEKITSAFVGAKLALERMVSEERGDTNFISIAIILVVVLGLAIVFIGFGNKLLPKLTEKINGIFSALG